MDVGTGLQMGPKGKAPVEDLGYQVPEKLKHLADSVYKSRLRNAQNLTMLAFA